TVGRKGRQDRSNRVVVDAGVPAALRNSSRARLFTMDGSAAKPACTRTDRGDIGGVVSQAELTDVSRYYDLLDLWTRLNRGFRVFSGLEAGAIHRWLDDPDSGEFSPTTIHKIMLAAGIGEQEPIEALDAGCGYGGTMFAFQAARGGHWHGITISPRQ